MNLENDQQGFIFLKDLQQPRSFLLDSGANCNLISLQHLTHNEKQTIDKKSVIKITGFNKVRLHFHLGKWKSLFTRNNNLQNSNST